MTAAQYEEHLASWLARVDALATAIGAPRRALLLLMSRSENWREFDDLARFGEGFVRAALERLEETP